MALNSVKVHNYENKIDIWVNPYGYSTKSKLDDMNIDFDANRFDVTVGYAREIVNEQFEDISRLADTFTYMHEIKGGYESQNYNDIPYIIPYLVEKAEHTVISICGGGFAYKTIDGSPSGGKNIAERLNSRGINVFVLHYRSNPYKFPIPMLDLQRAIRYIRYNAKRFNINPDKISLIGFSSGGYIASSFINQYMGQNHFSDEYALDEIDEISDKVLSASFIYPALSFEYNMPMLTSVVKYDELMDESKRENLLNELDIKNHFSSSNIPQFLAYTNKDEIINQDSVEDYIRVAKENKISVTRIFVPNEKHGFSDDLYVDEFEKWIKGF